MYLNDEATRLPKEDVARVAPYNLPVEVFKVIASARNKSDEQDPTGLAANDPGAKLDAGKVMAGTLSDFSAALMEVAKVGTFGAKKYSRGGFLHVENGKERYLDALYRHLLKMGNDYGAMDEETNLTHLAAVAWNALAILQYHATGK